MDLTIKQPLIYETSNVDLAAFLLLEDVKLLECVASDQGRNIVIMRFLDSKENCLDLERIFLNSNYKRYRDLNKYLLKRIHETLRK
jgi:hypothetical protein